MQNAAYVDSHNVLCRAGNRLGSDDLGLRRGKGLGQQNIRPAA